MLYYFECQKCKNVTDLYLESELPKDNVICNTCEKNGGSLVIKQQTQAFFFGCANCKGQWLFFDNSAYSDQKQSRPVCPTCNTNEKVFFVPPNMSPQKTQKRQTPGLLNPDEHDLSSFPEIKPEVALSGIERLKKGEFKAKPPSKKLHLVKDPIATKRIKTEVAYKTIKKRRHDYDTKYGKLEDTDNPLKTGSHIGRVVPFEEYKKSMKYTVDIDGTKYPRLNNSSPTVVNSAKIINRSKTWDYRATGPNSFLRRLCSLLYTINYDTTAKGSTYNPIELQALWANGSLYISSNNYSYMEKLYDYLKEPNTSLQTLVGEIKLSASDTGKFKTKPRNFNKEYQTQLGVYKKSIQSNKATDYKPYFFYQWDYVFEKLRDSVTWKNSCETLTVSKNGGDYTKWSVPAFLKTGKIYLVVPEKNQGFIKKGVHAEQLFYPILIELDKQNKLSAPRPAFIGGVKTPCRTCSEVLNAAYDLLQEKLRLPTDAFGHYWEASAKHVSDVTFTPSDKTIVFGNDESDNIFDTEMPMSPPHE